MIMRALVITVSDRAAAGEYEDRSGPIIEQALVDLGATAERVVVADGEPLRAELAARLAEGYDVIITTGGTGLGPRDLTPEITGEVLTRELPHLAAAIARYGADHGVPAALLSRGLAGTAGRTLVVNLPGSTGGARDGMAVLAPVLGHAVDQLGEGDHGVAP